MSTTSKPADTSAPTAAAVPPVNTTSAPATAPVPVAKPTWYEETPMEHPSVKRVWTEFVEYFEQNWHNYDKARLATVKILEDVLSRHPRIPKSIESRTKEVKSAATTAERRIKDYYDKGKGKDPMDKMEQVLALFNDLIGLRITLYFPSQRADVGLILQDSFVATVSKDWSTSPNKGYKDYTSMFKGYDAMHWEIRLKDDDVKKLVARHAQSRVAEATQDMVTMGLLDKRQVIRGNLPRDIKDDLAKLQTAATAEFDKLNLGGCVIEVQLMTGIMNWWQKVQHDLVYKENPAYPLTISDARMLDTLAGIVHTGQNTMLLFEDMLYKKLEEPKRMLEDEYEFGTFLSHWLGKPSKPSTPSPETSEGSKVPYGKSIAFRPLAGWGMATPETLKAIRGAEEWTDEVSLLWAASQSNIFWDKLSTKLNLSTKSWTQFKEKLGPTTTKIDQRLLRFQVWVALNAYNLWFAKKRNHCVEAPPKPPVGATLSNLLSLLHPTAGKSLSDEAAAGLRDWAALVILGKNATVTANYPGLPGSDEVAAALLGWQATARATVGASEVKLNKSVRYWKTTLPGAPSPWPQTLASDSALVGADPKSERDCYIVETPADPVVATSGKEKQPASQPIRAVVRAEFYSGLPGAAEPAGLLVPVFLGTRRGTLANDQEQTAANVPTASVVVPTPAATPASVAAPVSQRLLVVDRPTGRAVERWVGSTNDAEPAALLVSHNGKPDAAGCELTSPTHWLVAELAQVEGAHAWALRGGANSANLDPIPFAAGVAARAPRLGPDADATTSTFGSLCFYSPVRKADAIAAGGPAWHMLATSAEWANSEPVLEPVDLTALLAYLDSAPGAGSPPAASSTPSTTTTKK